MARWRQPPWPRASRLGTELTEIAGAGPGAFRLPTPLLLSRESESGFCAKQKHHAATAPGAAEWLASPRIAAVGHKLASAGAKQYADERVVPPVVDLAAQDPFPIWGIGIQDADLVESTRARRSAHVGKRSSSPTGAHLFSRHTTKE